MPQYIEIAGKQFGLWVAEKEEDTPKHAAPRWRCLCRGCGKRFSVMKSSLLGGVSLGCRKCRRSGPYSKWPKHDISGQRFGRLVAVEPALSSKGSDSRGRARTRWKWKCICDCGKAAIADPLSLKKGTTQSCGCLRREMTGSNHPFWTGHGEIRGHYWAQVKQGAATRNLPFEITIEYAWQLFVEQGGLCALSGMLIQFGIGKHGRSRKMTASLDRIDSRNGYIQGNVQWIHKDINQMKMDLDEQYFIRVCMRIVSHSRKKRRLAATGFQSQEAHHETHQANMAANAAIILARQPRAKDQGFLDANREGESVEASGL